MIAPYPNYHENPPFKVIRIGAHTAFKMHEKRNIIDICLNKNGFDKEKDQLCIVAGEIDCRLHLWRSAIRDNITIDLSIIRTINAFFLLLDQLISEGFSLITYSSPGSSWRLDSPEYPVFGTEVERNKITVDFNKLLGQESAKRGLKYLDLTKYLITPEFTTIRQYYMDKIHLGSAAFPLIMKEFNELR